MNKSSRFFYGWWIMFFCFMMMTLIYAPIANIVSLFVLPVTKELKIAPSQFFLYFTVLAISGMVVAPFVSKLIKKLGIKIYLVIFITMAAIAFIGFSYATKIIHIYIFAVFMGFGMVGGSLIPVSVLITNWFNEKRGLSLGITLAGSGFGGIILSPLVQWLITIYGWRGAYLFLGIIIFVVLVPLTLLLVVLHPTDKGLLPLGNEASGKQASNMPKEELSGTSSGETYKSPSFWFLCAAILIGGITVNTMLLCLAPYLNEIGSTSEIAAWLISLGSAVVIVAKILVGRTFDKLGLLITLFVISLCSLVSFIFLKNANSLVPAILYSILSGIGSTAITVTPAFVTAALFGKKDFSAKFSIASIFISLGVATTPIILGLLYNINKSYSWVINILIILSVVQFVLFFIAVKTRPNIEDNSNSTKEKSAN